MFTSLLFCIHGGSIKIDQTVFLLAKFCQFSLNHGVNLIIKTDLLIIYLNEFIFIQMTLYDDDA